MADYNEVIQKAVDKEAEIIGDRAIEIAEENGIIFDSEGEVEDYRGIGRKKLEKIVDEYSEIGGKITPALVAREIRKIDTSNIRLPENIKENM